MIPKQRHPRLLYHVVAFLVVAIWGSTFVFTKLLLLSGFTPAQIFTLRFLIAYAMLLAFCLWRGIRWFSDTWKDELLMLGLGVSGGSLYFLAENGAMNYTTTTNTSLIVCLCPLFASALIGFFYKSQRLNRTQLIGTLMAAAGVVVVVMNGHFVLHLSPIGDTLAFIACLCWAVYSLLMIPANAKYDTVFITRKVFFYGLLSMIPYYIYYPGLNVHLLFEHTSLLWNLLFLGCVASTMCFLAWNWTMKKLGAVVVTNYVYFNPVTTILFAWLLLSEPITLFFLIGTVLILVGMYLSDKHKHSNTMRKIRRASENDLPRILELIDFGRQKMRAMGNMDQWTHGNPRREVLLEDIEKGNSYIVEDDGEAVATFAFVEGPDVTYQHIYEGQWLDEPTVDGSVQTNYWVVHRMASAPEAHGIFKTVLDYCFSRTPNIRIDTHRQNTHMRRALEKYGFHYCGIIYLLDGAERLAYQRCLTR